MMDIGRNEGRRREISPYVRKAISPRGLCEDYEKVALGIVALEKIPPEKPKKALMIVMPTQPVWKVDPSSPMIDRGCGVTPTLHRRSRMVNRILVPNHTSPNHSGDFVQRIHSGSRSPVTHFPRNSAPRLRLSRGKKRPYGVNALAESLKDPLRDSSLRCSQSPSVCKRTTESRNSSTAASSRLRFSYSRKFPTRYRQTQFREN